MAGVTAMETSTAGVTVSVVEPEIPPKVAVAVVLPAPTLFASPAAEIVAIVVSVVLHRTEVVMSRVLPSV